MAKKIKFGALNIGFVIGFGYGAWQFVMLNYFAYQRFIAASDSNGFCDPCPNQFGFPTALYEQVRWAEPGDIIWFGLVINVLFATICAIIIGLVCSAVYSWVRDS